MDLDNPKSENETVSDHETDNERQSPPQMPPQSPQEQTPSSTDDDSSPEQPPQPKRLAQGIETAPPPRVLPFTQRTRSNAPTAAKSDPEADGGETDDDEL